MNSEVPVVQLAEVSNLVMGQSPAGDSYNDHGVGVPLLNGPTEFGPNHPTPAQWTTAPTRLCNSGDILFCVRGSTTGRTNWADQRYCIGRGLCAISASTGAADTRFIYYSLVHQLDSLLALTAGSVFPNLSKQDLETFEIKWPDGHTRLAMVSILGELDERIELNRKMNQTLEAIGRAIFKSWFIDFDPVHAKAAGEQPYGMDSETAALFPDSFADSQLGPIPAGWQVGILTDMMEIIGGGTPKTSIPEYWNGAIPWFSVKDVPDESDVFVIDTDKHITQAGADNSSANVLPQGTSIISARGTVGKIALVGVPMAMNQSCYGIRGSSGYPDLFTHFQLRFSVSELQQKTHGTVFDTITRNTFRTIQTVIPPAIVTQEFDHCVRPILDMIKANLLQSRTLAELRDTLLPRLISGRLRIPVAEQIMEDVL